MTLLFFNDWSIGEFLLFYLLVLFCAWFVWCVLHGKQADDQRRIEDDEQARKMADFFKDSYKDGERPFIK